MFPFRADAVTVFSSVADDQHYSQYTAHGNDSGHSAFFTERCAVLSETSAGKLGDIATAPWSVTGSSGTFALYLYDLSSYASSDCSGSPIGTAGSVQLLANGLNPADGSVVVFDASSLNVSLSGAHSVQIRTTNLNSTGSCGTQSGAPRCGTYGGASYTDYLVLTDTPNSIGPTRVVAMVPAQSATTTSPVDFSLTAFVNEDDLNSFGGVYIGFRLVDENFSTFSPVLFEGYATTSGAFNFSTTSVAVPDGNYAIEAVLFKRYLDLVTGTLYEPKTVHEFVVGSPTFFGSLFQDLTEDVHGYTTGLGTTSSSDALGACSPISFSTATCVSVLFVPKPEAVKYLFDTFKDDILRKVPWGYVTRFTEIMLFDDPVEPPALEYSFGSSSPAILGSLTSGDPVTFQIWDNFDTLSTVVADDGSGKNIWDIIDPYVSVVVAFAVLLVILSDLVGIEILRDRTQEYSSDIVYEGMEGTFRTRVQGTRTFRKDGSKHNEAYVVRIPLDTGTVKRKESQRI